MDTSGRLDFLQNVAFRRDLKVMGTSAIGKVQEDYSRLRQEPEGTVVGKASKNGVNPI